MNKFLGVFILLFCFSPCVFGAGVSEKDIDAEYASKTYAERADWLYEFNQMANKVHTGGKEIEKYSDGTYSGLLNSAMNSFDEYSYRYKVLLDIGVKYTYIDDRTRREQLAKLRAERDNVSRILSASSGLGL